MKKWRGGFMQKKSKIEKKFVSLQKFMYLISHIPQIKELCEQHKVDKLYAFGSVLTDRFTKDSDVDLLVDIKDKDPISYSELYFDLKFKLEDLFNRPVDLLEERAIKNPYFRQYLDETKQLIYG